MTKQELSKKYGVAENSITKKFPSVKDSIMKKWGVLIIKEGRGDSADYREVKVVHAPTISQEGAQEVIMIKESLSGLIDFNFLVFLGICMTPMTTFYGSYEEFLEYVELTKSKGNVKLLKEALQKLSDSEYINYTVDKTNNNYFWAGLFYSTREKMSISIGMINRCKMLAEKYNKKSWIPLLKTWIGMQYMYSSDDSKVFTVKELSALTGLSAYQLRENKKILERSDDEGTAIISTKKVYAGYDNCMGTTVNLNALVGENMEFVNKSMQN